MTIYTKVRSHGQTHKVAYGRIQTPPMHVAPDAGAVPLQANAVAGGGVVETAGDGEGDEDGTGGFVTGTTAVVMLKMSIAADSEPPLSLRNES